MTPKYRGSFKHTVFVDSLIEQRVGMAWVGYFTDLLGL